jgi:asparagine synthase (glutamine-hydrolysing)
MKSSLFTKDFMNAVGNENSNLPTQQLFEHLTDISPLNQMLYVDTKTWLPDDLLVKADKITMATSVELRVPLLDFQILEFATSLPQHYKVLGWSLKRILKAALSESVPREVLNRKKTGFPVPYDYWMQKDMKEFVFDNIIRQNSELSIYFSKTKLREILEAHQRGEGYSKEIFSLLVLELWLQTFLQNGGCICKIENVP